jgi:para-nitrobenzyl esterase
MTTTDVEVGTGRLCGTERDGIRVFKGIPYAAPPVGELRFAAPRPPLPWSGVRPAARFAESAPQAAVVAGSFVAATGEQAVIGSEDCLYLNVYAPAERGRHPVIVWIHGGGAVMGSPSECDPTRLAQLGVVVVTVAYRLGALGLLHLPGVFDADADCNFALLDQIAALRWVRDNVVAFDGDPERVTVAGASNGGRTVGTLLAAPAARGLFTRAVAMSGTGVGRLVAEPQEAERVTAALLSELGLTAATAARLRELSTERIVAAQTRLRASWPTLIPFQVVVDGASVPERPLDAVARGAARGVALLVGTTHDEYDYFAKVATNVPGASSMLVGREALERVRASYRRLLPGDWSDEGVRRHVLTSADWWIPAIRLAEAHVRAGGRAWMYRLDWRLAPRGQGIGAPHGLDAAVMNPGDPELAGMLAAADRDPAGLEEIVEGMRAALGRFAERGDPAPAWPAYDLEARSTLLLDDVCSVARDPDRDLRVAWDGIV